MRDRGSIKWVSLMLPEHVKTLKAWQDNQKAPPMHVPDWDDQQFNTLNMTLYQALYEQVLIELHYVHDYQLYTVRGYVKTIDEAHRIIAIQDEDEHRYQIHAENVTNIFHA